MKQTIERLRGEFLEMPGLRLSVTQTQRLCGVDSTICQAVLDALVVEQFLRVNTEGIYCRVSDGALSCRHPVKVALSSGQLLRKTS